MRHLAVLLDSRLVWGASWQQAGAQYSGLEDKCVFYIPGGAVTLWLAPYGVSFV